MDIIPPAFASLQNVKQFIIYKLVPNTEHPGKFDKLPLHFQTGHKTDLTNPINWTDFSTALITANLWGASFGVGFVLTEHDPYFFLDIDNCFDNGQWSSVALKLCQLFNGAAIEVSSSGCGLHILGRGKIAAHTSRNKEHKLEFYTANRFVALTGFNIIGNIETDCSAILPQVVNEYFSVADKPVSVHWTAEPVPDWNGPQEDNELIRRALLSQSARAALGMTATFADLWNANTAVLDSIYTGDESSIDAALAQHLAFWTGNNCERIHRLMLQSKLVREKWQREDYLPRTILQACAKQAAKKEWLKDIPVAQASHETEETVLTNGTRFLTPEHQIELFKGCVYIQDLHKILVPGGDLLKPEQFRARYGGYSFMMDTGNQRVSRNAWECFTESQAIRFPQAQGICFKPDKKAAEIITFDDRKHVNTYWPLVIPRQRGDITPFLNHLKKLLPDERDQLILLSYIAACVQFKGVKFQWAPVIQGVEGNGKTIISQCTAFAVGYRYTFTPRADQIGNNFNKWLYGHILIAVEDIYVPGQQREILEILKPMITNNRLSIEAKGVDQQTLEICCNFILNTNHRDGLPKTQNDRRYAPLYTSQQNKEDLLRDGLTPQYMNRLYNWLNNENGYAIVSEFLHSYEFPEKEFNPANKQIAPLTSSTDIAIKESRGSLEQEIIEAIEQDLLGFKGGWISSMQLDNLLNRANNYKRIPHNKRREILHTLDYELHPHLSNGRVNNPILPDNGKPKLFIHKTNPARNLRDSAAIAQAYSKAQNTDS